MLVSVSGGRDLRALARDLKAAGDNSIRRDLQKDIRAAMKPMKAAVQANARAIPAKGPRHTGLRDDIAKATRIRVPMSASSAAVILEVAGSRMPAGKQKLPSYMEGNGRWRHPVFGNEHTWVGQTAHPYFWKGVEPHLQDVRKAVVQAVEDALDKVDL